LFTAANLHHLLQCLIENVVQGFPTPTSASR